MDVWFAVYASHLICCSRASSFASGTSRSRTDFTAAATEEAIVSFKSAESFFLANFRSLRDNKSSGEVTVLLVLLLETAPPLTYKVGGPFG